MRRVMAFGGPCCDPDLERTCQECGAIFCLAHDGSALEPDYCPNHQDPFAVLDAGRTPEDKRTA